HCPQTEAPPPSAASCPRPHPHRRTHPCPRNRHLWSHPHQRTRPCLRLCPLRDLHPHRRTCPCRRRYRAHHRQNRPPLPPSTRRHRQPTPHRQRSRQPRIS